ncbi:MAG: LysM peptidoglycan-binding domain-containing protein [Proteobacteria bacterium]|nr:LysM peptidoglycan-binding domain-containing protein [Pseudomonadota bacterium]
MNSVRGPTRKWLLYAVFWLSLLLVGVGCASDSETEDIGLDEPLEDFDTANSEEAFSNEEENVVDYNNLNVSNPSQGEQNYGEFAGDNNYNYDQMNVGEGDNLGNTDESLANNSYDVANAEDSDGYDQTESAEGYDQGGFSDESNSYSDGQNTLAEQGYEGNENVLANSNLTNNYSESGNSYNSYGDQSADMNQVMNALNNSYPEEEMANSDPLASADSEYGYDSMDSADATAGMAQPVSEAGLPEMGSKMDYIVRKGDTLGSIATMIYGSKEKWSEISMLSGLQNPNLIYPGDVVYYLLSDASMAFAASYENTSKGEVTVGEGDTLSTLAAQVYGDSGQWKALWRANDAIDNPDQLTPGEIVYFVNYSNVMAAVDHWQEYFLASASVEIINQGRSTVFNESQDISHSNIQVTEIEESQGAQELLNEIASFSYTI